MWKKKSIFWELEYWKVLDVRSAIDVMHVTKNICVNLLSFLGVYGKTNDTKEARQDQQRLKDPNDRHPEWFQGRASYALTKEEKVIFFECLSSMKVPSGFSSNIKGIINMADKKFQNLKSHDCHVIMTQLLPIALRGLLPENVRVAIVKLCAFLNAISQKVINPEDLPRLQNDVVQCLVSFELVFPPSFFNIMTHLLVHLVEEISILGPVFLHNMFPFERFMGVLKKYVRNRARPEGSIAKGYGNEEQAGEIDNLTVSLGQSTLVVCVFHVGAGIVAPHYIPPPSTFNVLLGSYWFDNLGFILRETCRSAGGTFMSITLGEATKLLDNMMINYSEWHTERAPQGKKVNSVEETSSLSDKIDAIISMLVNDRTNIDPNNVPLASLVAQEEHVDVNFIKNNNFNNNAYRNNSSNNYRPYPYNNGNGYGNSYGNSYNNNRSSPPGLEAMLKEFISTQTAFNKSVEEKLGKIDILASKVDSLAADVDLLKSKVMPNENHHNKIVTTANAIQVRINENIRLMAELRARWDREENEKLAKEKNIAKVWTITTTCNANATHVAAPPTINNKRIGVSNVSTSNAKREKLPETAKTAETACDKAAEIFSNIGDDDPIALDYNGLNFDDCHISEVIKFLQKLAKSPNASAINLAFTHHITNALIKAREEKLEREASIPRKLEDGWEPIIKMKVKDFDCNALCDLGASISVMPKKIYNMLDLPPLKNCYLDVNLADHSTKKPLGKVDNVRITVNNNLVPVDFVVLDIECNASCPIILGRPFLRTVGAIIDMKEGNIKYQFPLKKGMEHFPRKRMKLPFDSIMRTNYDVDTSSLDNT
ncbi:hypothetical protein QYE76_060645 [Lolium multiflorum]|uniref:DUF4218 domain-containing protein n=1 Tax=Lolium multiflorum TaxID=4521 RepID=A0AAD8S1P2_LOLMU|nr:hypothetical protein QYE76_060645 [Lolium multiflorum]